MTNATAISRSRVWSVLTTPAAIPQTGPRLKTNLDTDLLKLIAIAAMLIDHIGGAFFPEVGVFRWIGRLAFPIFCYCLTVGLLYTHDIRRYLGRLAIFAVFAAAFFGQNGALAVFSLYVLGIVMAILTGLMLKHTIMRGEASPFVMELPVYHVPHIKSLIIQTWQRLKGFVLRAGKVIVIVSIFLSALNSFSLSGKVVDNINDSALASVSRVITPVFKPIGVHEDNWQATVGLFTGAMAKEVVVGTLNTLYTAEDIQNEEFNPQTFSLGEELLAAVDETWQGLKDTFSLSVLANPIEASKGDGEMATGAMGVMGSKFGSAAAAYSYLIFVLLYIPCISVMGAIARESSRGWMTFSILWGLNIAYSLSTLYYQTVSFSDHPRYSLVCILAVVLFNVVLFGLLRRARSRVDVSLLATRKTPASCCSSPAGDCH